MFIDLLLVLRRINQSKNQDELTQIFKRSCKRIMVTVDEFAVDRNTVHCLFARKLN